MNRTEVDRGHVLLSHSDTLIRRDVEEALRLVDEAVVIAQTEGDEGLLGRALHNRGYALTITAQYDEGLAVLHEALKIVQRNGHEGGILMVSSRIAAVHVSKGEYSQALEIYHDILNRTKDDPRRKSDRCFAYNALSACYSEMGELDRALDMVHAGLVLSEELQLPILTMQLLQNAGSFHIHLGNLEKAEELLGEARDRAIELEDLHIEAAAVVNLGIIANSRSDWSTARKHTERALQLYRRLGTRNGQIASIVSMAETAAGEGEIDEARRLLAEALDLSNPVEDRVTIAGIYAVRGDVNLAAGALEDALHDFSEGLRLTREIGMRREEMNANAGLAKGYERTGDPARALDHYKEFSRLREEILNEERQKVTAEYQARFDAVHAEHQREIYRLRAEDLEKDVRRREQELASQAMQLARQTEMLGKFRNELRAILRDGGRAEAAITAIREKLKNLPCEAIDWTKFEAQFQHSHPEFRSKLLKRYPDLTKMEMKICSMLKLRLTTNDIATLFCLSERSVESHRYNIRKKMGLGKGEDMRTVLDTL